MHVHDEGAAYRYLYEQALQRLSRRDYSEYALRRALLLSAERLLYRLQTSVDQEPQQSTTRHQKIKHHPLAGLDKTNLTRLVTATVDGCVAKGWCSNERFLEQAIPAWRKRGYSAKHITAKLHEEGLDLKVETLTHYEAPNEEQSARIALDRYLRRLGIKGVDLVEQNTENDHVQQTPSPRDRALRYLIQRGYQYDTAAATWHRLLTEINKE